MRTRLPEQRTPFLLILLITTILAYIARSHHLHSPSKLSMRNRIWHELGQTRYYVEFLSLYIAQTAKLNGRIKVFTAIFVIGSIIGWYRFDELKILWAILLVLIQLFILFKDFFLVSESQVSRLRTVLRFYNRHCRDLESLWFDFHEERITDDQARKKLNLLIKKELDMQELENHDRISGTKKQKNRADVATREYLDRIGAQ